MSKNYVKRHDEIIRQLEEMTQVDACIQVNSLAREVKSDPRTVRKHLEIAELDELGKFVNQDKSVFCTQKAIARKFGTIFDHPDLLREAQERWTKTFPNKSALEILGRK